jgi:23S rRNA pseudouridine1911/1915/1917 synthase
MTTPPFPILLEDNHLLAVVKPAGLPTMGVDASRPSLISLARQYLKVKYHKPGNVYVGVVSRLDAGATGVVVLARTSKAADRLARQFRERTVGKVYWALVARRPEVAATELVDWLRKDERQRKMVVCRASTEDAVEARLAYRVLREFDAAVLLEITLHTGRKHQIRVQLAARGMPILGDRQYGGQQPFPAGMALHARRLSFVHPVQKTPVELLAPIPRTWHRYGVR